MGRAVDLHTVAVSETGLPFDVGNLRMGGQDVEVLGLAQFGDQLVLVANDLRPL